MSIEERMAAVEGRLAALESRANGNGGGAHASSAASSDADIDSPWGDPVVKFKAPKWTGEDEAGRKMSECSPEFLDSLAGYYSWQARRDADENKTYVNKDGKTLPTAPLKLKDVARARAWAARIRAGRSGAAPAAAPRAPAAQAAPPAEMPDYGSPDPWEDPLPL